MRDNMEHEHLHQVLWNRVPRLGPTAGRVFLVCNYIVHAAYDVALSAKTSTSATFHAIDVAERMRNANYMDAHFELLPAAHQVTETTVKYALFVDISGWTRYSATPNTECEVPAELWGVLFYVHVNPRTLQPQWYSISYPTPTHHFDVTHCTFQELGTITLTLEEWQRTCHAYASCAPTAMWYFWCLQKLCAATATYMSTHTIVSNYSAFFAHCVDALNVHVATTTIWPSIPIGVQRFDSTSVLENVWSRVISNVDCGEAVLMPLRPKTNKRTTEQVPYNPACIIESSSSTAFDVSMDKT